MIASETLPAAALPLGVEAGAATAGLTAAWTLCSGRRWFAGLRRS